MTDPGPPRPKRARVHQGSSSDAAAMKMDNIDVEKYALSRGVEIHAMEKAMKASRDSGAQRAFQSLPRHLRRRAASHNIRRLPKRLRAKAKFEMLQDQAKALKKRKFRQLPISKRRKLLRFSRLEILHGRQRDKAWLETHLWHAKRMRMINTWGFRLAYTPTDKAFRPSYRASMHGVIVHDASYFQTLELKGTLEQLKLVLSMMCDPAEVAPYAKRYIDGLRECPVDLYESQSYPGGYIGPATIIWNTTPVVDNRTPPDVLQESDPPIHQLLLRFHPSILGAVANTVEKSLKHALTSSLSGESGSKGSLESSRGEARTIVSIFRSFCTFEISGPMATDTVKACLRPSTRTSREKLEIWKNLMPPAAVPTGTVLSLDVQDPRLNFPPTLPKSERSHGKSTFVKPSQGLAKNDSFWDDEHRKKLVAPQYSKKDLDERRSRNLVPGTKLSVGPEDDSIPIMLVQRSIGPSYADKKQRGNSEKNVIFGWTLIVPSGWGSAFWHSLAFADTRIGGIRERAQQYFEAGCPSFPEDYACTRAFKIEIDKKAKDLSARWHRTPIAKRVNYAQLSTTSPWRPAFSGVTSTSSPYVFQPDHAKDDEEARRALRVLGHANDHSPYLIGGPLLAKVLPAATQSLRSIDSPVTAMLKVQDTFETHINSFRARRQLGPAKPLMIDALVKVSLNPLSRGSPKYNAMIYMLTESQVYMIRDQLKRGRKNHDIVTLHEHEELDTEEVRVRHGRPLPESSMDGDEGDFEQGHEHASTSLSEMKAPHVFPVPSADDIMGYITTGNMSLARGKGQGLGAVSFLKLAQVMAVEDRATLYKSDLKLLVMFKNPASQYCRLATLEVLE